MSFWCQVFLQRYLLINYVKHHYIDIIEYFKVGVFFVLKINKLLI